jgi:hypothetical protein
MTAAAQHELKNELRENIEQLGGDPPRPEDGYFPDAVTPPQTTPTPMVTS